MAGDARTICRLFWVSLRIERGCHVKKTAIAIGLAATVGVASFAGTAVAAQDRPSFKSFKVTVTPSKPKAGHAITAVGTGAPKSAAMDCIEVLLKKGFTPGQSQSYIPTLRTPNSNAAGKVVCQDKFMAFHDRARGKMHYCPPTKADKKAGWGCGIVIASSDNKYIGVAKFKF